MQDLIQQWFEIVRRHGVGDATRILQHIFLFSLNEHLVHDAEHLAGGGVVHRAAAIAGIGRGVQLEDIVRLAQEFDVGGAQITRVRRRNNDGNDRRYRAGMGDGI